jgi:hypothetical protein
MLGAAAQGQHYHPPAPGDTVSIPCFPHAFIRLELLELGLGTVSRARLPLIAPTVRGSIREATHK